MAARMAKSVVNSVFRPNLFKNKVAVVTGGATGIGKAITQELAFLGCKVVIASRKADKLVCATQEIQEAIPGCDISWHECNIRKEDQVESLISTTLERHGQLDFLVNNGGGQFLSPAASFNLKGWNAVIETNLTGTFLCCKQAYHQWMGEHGGSIVNIVADMWKGMPGMSHSGAARAGVDNLTKTLAVEWAGNGIRMNSVAPGSSIFSETAAANYGEENAEIFNENIPYIPMRRLGTVEEISAAVCYLLSPAAAFITGETVIVDGGGWLHNGRWPTGENKIPAYRWRDDIAENDDGTPKSKL